MVGAAVDDWQGGLSAVDRVGYRKRASKMSWRRRKVVTEGVPKGYLQTKGETPSVTARKLAVPPPS